MAATRGSVATALNVEVVATRVSGHRRGRLVACGEDGLLVDYEGNPHGPLPAQSTVALSSQQAKELIETACPMLVTFLEERSDSPVVVGVLQPVPTSETPSPDGSAFTARVDGKRLRLEAKDEIELRCGEASITLRRNGRLVIRGAFVETRARGVNRIKGGSVQIN